MSMKGLFNLNRSKESTISNFDEVEKIKLRINALDVHIKRLLNFEKELRLSMSQVDEHVEKKRDSGKQIVFKRIDELTRRLDQLEHLVQNDRLSKQDRSLNDKEEEKRLEHLVESILERKLIEYSNTDERMSGYIHSFEDKGTKDRPEEEYAQLESESKVDRQSKNHENEHNECRDSAYSSIQKRLFALEQNFSLLSEGQALLFRQVNELVEKCSKTFQKTQGLEEQHDTIHKTIYIDNLYLDKYEQNNNIAQLGVKELSGAINIGATYGTVPKKIKEQVKKDIEKQVNKEKNESLAANDNESSESHPYEDDVPFTEIQIEDDETKDD